ncbi:hypothetical protein [Ruegeria atlantica]|uniref:hypothetical protein n=1 Tax=Ruegeria atlantica TaxID=81569 RepID=UPI00147E89D5|nr:hypothetical protein [Ruegeria atlantica]
MRTGAFFKTAGQPPIEIPSAAIPAAETELVRRKATREHESGIWFKEPCTEHALVSEVHDFALSLIHLGDAPSRFEPTEVVEEDTYDRMVNRTPDSSWLG